jgi:NAD-dependent dihydropyrimidine dehydrogenase PreA subunit
MRYLSNVVTLKYDPSLCTGCGRCLEVCPHRVFRMEAGKAALADREVCMECGACMRNCAPGALTVRSGVGCAYGIITSKLKGKSEVECDCS